MYFLNLNGENAIRDCPYRFFYINLKIRPMHLKLLILNHTFQHKI